VESSSCIAILLLVAPPLDIPAKMPSRKKAKGKARKAAKEAAEDKDESQVIAANQRPLGLLDVMQHDLFEVLQRMRNDAVIPQNCRHGLINLSPGEQKIFEEFINSFIDEYTSGDDSVGGSLLSATAATKEKHAEVYSSKLESVVSILLCSGTKCILNGDNHTASLYAILISYFEQWKTVKVRKTKATFSWTNAFELNDADDHTLVQYFRKRIPCACLQEKYTEVKSIKKMGWCYNTKCSLPGRKVQRSKMLYCTRCCDANYCSIECQKADWKRHRSDCDRAVETKAKQS